MFESWLQTHLAIPPGSGQDESESRPILVICINGPWTKFAPASVEVSDPHLLSTSRLEEARKNYLLSCRYYLLSSLRLLSAWSRECAERRGAHSFSHDSFTRSSRQIDCRIAWWTPGSSSRAAIGRRILVGIITLSIIGYKDWEWGLSYLLRRLNSSSSSTSRPYFQSCQSLISSRSFFELYLRYYSSPFFDLSGEIWAKAASPRLAN